MIPSESLPRPGLEAGLKLLAGTRVLDLTTSIAGTYTTMLLGDFGAEMIKIELTKVLDDLRHRNPPSYADQCPLVFERQPKQEKRLAGLSRDEDREVLRGLIEQSDVIVTN